MFHIFTDYVNYIQIKIWRKYCVCAASRDFGSHLAHSCGPEMEHRPRKLEFKKCIRGCELYTVYGQEYVDQCLMHTAVCMTDDANAKLFVSKLLVRYREMGEN